jgi:hypothetical protein
VKLRTVSLEYRDHDDGNHAFLVFKEKTGEESHLEWDFVLEALALRANDLQAFEFLWSLLDLLAERGAPLEELRS